MSGSPAVRGALTAAAHGFRSLGHASSFNGDSTGLAPYSVPQPEVARSVLGSMASTRSVDRLARQPQFAAAVGGARRYARGLERAGIPFADQVREAGFPDPAAYLGGLAFQTHHDRLTEALTATFHDGPDLGGHGVGQPAEVRAVLGDLTGRLQSYGAGAFPGSAGRMALLQQAGWWSFNPPASHRHFDRYARSFLQAASYLQERGGSGRLADLALAVQRAGGYPPGSLSAEEHFRGIQDEILRADFGVDQGPLARLFEL
jgi:hypothetical protein